MTSKDISEAERQELFDSAIMFLRDPTVGDAPLTKKIEFLEKKGLNPDEIERALKIAKEASSDDHNGSAETTSQQDQPRPAIGADSRPTHGDRNKNQYTYQAIPPALPERDWKDYFIMTTATAGLLYGLFEVTKRYVVPNILPESKSKLDQDKEEMQKQFAKVDKLLDALEQEQSDFREKENQKLQELDTTIAELQRTLNDTTRTRETMENDFKLLKLELNHLQSSVDKFVSGNDTIQELNQMSNEITSLKNLIKNSSFGAGAAELGGKTTSNVALNDSIRSELETPLNPTTDIKSPISGIPGVDAIPSAAELLAKMSFNDSDDNESKNKETPNMPPVPAWKQAREQTASKIKSNNLQEEHNNELPAWQAALEAAQGADGQ